MTQSKVALDQISAYAKRKQRSEQSRILSRARNVLVRREIRRSINASLRRRSWNTWGEYAQATQWGSRYGETSKGIVTIWPKVKNMATIGMSNRENLNEIVGNLSRDAVQLIHPNWMALLAMNNEIFSNGMEAHLEAQQPMQNPLQPVYNPPPPQKKGVRPWGPASSPSSPAFSPPSWIATAGGLGMATARIGSGLPGNVSGHGARRSGRGENGSLRNASKTHRGSCNQK